MNLSVIARCVFLLCFIFVVNGCGTTKAYVGDLEEGEQLAKINAPDRKYTDQGWSLLPGVMDMIIVSVDDLPVGDALKGYPSHVFTREGVRVVKLQFFDKSFMKTLLNSGYAKESGKGVVYINEGQSHFISIACYVEGGKEYAVVFDAQPNDISSLKVSCKEVG